MTPDQPETTEPLLTENDRLISISTQTEGASIGYKINPTDPESRSGWSVYSDPFETNSGDTIYVISHRIGFKPSELIFHVCK